jgi:hypothetical protein
MSKLAGGQTTLEGGSAEPLAGGQVAQLAGGAQLEGGQLAGGEMEGGEMEGGSRKQKAAAKRNPWLIHVRGYQRSHKNLSWSECLKKARSSYRKSPRSGKKRSSKKKSSKRR